MGQRDIISTDESVTQAAAIGSVGESQVSRSLLKVYLELGKARLSGMVVVTTGLGYVVADRGRGVGEPFNFQRLIWTCLGTFLAAVGASAFNQAIEARRDARMNRTRNRPIPAGEISRTHAAFFGLIVSIIGVAILCPTSNGLTAVLATVNVLLYAVVYTPMKRLTSLNTLVGAVVGGIPPMMGWAAASGSLSAGAWILGSILFVWQIPHFLALAWMYRVDYARGGFKMLSITEPTGVLTSLCAVLYSVLLLPLNLALVRLHHAGMPFGVMSAVLTVGLVVLAVRFAMTRSNVDARRLFLASISYLPLLTAVLMLDARGRFDGMSQTTAGYELPQQ